MVQLWYVENIVNWLFDFIGLLLFFFFFHFLMGQLFEQLKGWAKNWGGEKKKHFNCNSCWNNAVSEHSSYLLWWRYTHLVSCVDWEIHFFFFVSIPPNAMKNTLSNETFFFFLRQIQAPSRFCMKICVFFASNIRRKLCRTERTQKERAYRVMFGRGNAFLLQLSSVSALQQRFTCGVEKLRKTVL